MIRRRGTPGAPRLPSLWRTASLVGAVLVLGFLILPLPPVQFLFGAVAQDLAVCAALVLRLLGFDVVQTGIEIRDLVTDHAIAVTAACDGSSLLIGLGAAWLWLQTMTGARRSIPVTLAVSIAAILVFNLLRIVLLFLAIPVPGLMTAEHLYIAPLLSAVLVIALALFGRAIAPKSLPLAPWIWAGAVLALAVAWFWLSAPVTCALIVPIGNTLLWLMPFHAAGSISCVADAGLLTTALASPTEAGSVITLPFYPTDFTLPLPLVMAGLLACRRWQAGLQVVALTLVLFALAMALGAITTSADHAAAVGVGTVIGPGFVQTYHAPAEIVVALLKAVQNAVVHFNLFVLPLVALGLASAVPAIKATPTSTPTTGRTRRRRA